MSKASSNRIDPVNAELDRKMRMVHAGYLGEAQRGEDGKYHGFVLNAPEPTVIEGNDMVEVQKAFVAVVDRLRKAGQEPEGG